MKGKHQIVRLRSKKCIKEIKELQTQFFGVFKSEDMKQVMDYYKDRDSVELFKRKKRLDDVCTKLDLALKKFNCHSIITLIDADFEYFYLASCPRYGKILDGKTSVVKIVKHQPLGKPVFFANVQEERPFSKIALNYLEKYNITSVYILPIKNMSDNEIGFLSILLHDAKQYEHIKHLKEIDTALRKLKVVLTTSDVDIQEQRRSNSG